MSAEARTRGTIVCGVNDTPEARAAAERAALVADRLGSRLVLVHVVETDGVHDPALRYELDGTEWRVIESMARQLAARTQAETRVVFGERAELLARVAAEEGADVLVLGSRAQGRGGRDLHYGLAREVEAATPTPVLLVPPSS